MIPLSRSPFLSVLISTYLLAVTLPAVAAERQDDSGYAGDTPVVSDESAELQAVRQAASEFDEKSWFAAQRRKEDHDWPEIATEPSDAVLAQQGKLEEPVFVGVDSKAEVRYAEFPKDRRLAGFGGLGLEVKPAGNRLDGFLLIPIGKQLAAYDPATIRIARWDEELGEYLWVHGSGVASKHNVVWARIGRGGRYAAFGAFDDPLIDSRLRSFCTIREGFEFVDRIDAEQRFQDVCPQILCPAGPGFDGPFSPGESICDMCLGTPSVGRLEPCDLYLPQPSPRCDPSCGWTSVGPVDVSGHVRRVIVDPTNSNRLYAVAWEGGAWVLDSVRAYPGTRWRPLTDTNTTLRLSTIAVAPSLGRTLYIGSQLGTVFRSTNRGVNWMQVGIDLGNTIRDLVVHPTNAARLWAFNADGLFESTDGGDNWTETFDSNISDFKLDPSNPDIRYLAEAGVGVHKTENGGADWNLIFDFADANAPAVGRIEIALGRRNADGSLQDPDDRTVVIRVADEVWANDQGGSGTWSALGVRGNWGDPKQLNWNHVIAVSPFDPRVIFAGGRVMHRRKADDSNTWEHVAGFRGKVHEDQHSVAFDPNDANIVYISNDGGVFRSFDGGRSFNAADSTREDEIAAGRNLNLGLTTAEFYRVGVQVNDALGNLFHSGIIGSEDLDSGWWTGPGEGHSWEWRSILSDARRRGHYFVMTDPLMKRLFPGTGAPRRLLRFSDFKPVPSGNSRIVGAITVDMRAGATTILAAAQKSASEPHRLMITREADRIPERDEASGAWSNLPAWSEAFQTSNAGGDQINAVTFAPRSAQAYAMTSSGRTFFNSNVDSSTTWTEREQWSHPTWGIVQMAVAPGVPNLIYAIRRDRVARSRQGGSTGSWEEVGGGTLPPTTIRSIAVHPSNEFVLFLGADDGVYMSVDQGDHWEPIDNSLPNAVVRQVYVEGGYLYAVTHGRGLWRLALCAIPRGA